jgi:hypothetical protein
VAGSPDAQVHHHHGCTPNQPAQHRSSTACWCTPATPQPLTNLFPKGQQGQVAPCLATCLGASPAQHTSHRVSESDDVGDEPCCREPNLFVVNVSADHLKPDTSLRKTLAGKTWEPAMPWWGSHPPSPGTWSWAVLLLLLDLLLQLGVGARDDVLKGVPQHLAEGGTAVQVQVLSRNF